MISAREMFCARCGRAFSPGDGAIRVYVDGVPACPDCGGSGFVAATCQWCETVFLWMADGGNGCPLCTHTPYWAD